MARARGFRKQDGFTIIEVMVASLILLVGILGVTTIVNTANSTTTSNKAREQGLSLAREVIESARSVKYQSLRPSTAVATLQAMPGFANAGAGAGWTIKRRGIIYNVSVGVCSVDDPGDGTGAHVAGAFCSRSSVQATADKCQGLIGQPPKINGVGGSPGADAGDCGLDTDLDGQVNGLVQAAASPCPAGSSVSAGTCDAQPDDFKRLVTLVTWDRGAGSRYVLQQATEPFPGLSAYGAITSLPLDGGFPLDANGYTDADWTADKLTFTATSSQTANQVDWLLGGVDQGPFDSWSGTTGSFLWNVGKADPSKTTPVAGEMLDGSYLLGARVQDAGGIHGAELDAAVTLNRRIPFPPGGFSIAGAAFDAKGLPTQVVASWNAPPDRDLVGYRLYRQVGSSSSYSSVPGCDQIAVTDRTCTDLNPPGSSSVTYWVVALDKDPTSGAVRPGQESVKRSIQTANIPPTVPKFYDHKVTGGGSGISKVQLWWTASTDPDDPVDGYEIYRTGCTATTLVGTALGTATTLTDTNAPKSASCTYRVRAKDQGGAFSPFSPDYGVAT
jgi:prepilin-type N-terminal cleavage/methylation domain-containing protein